MEKKAGFIFVDKPEGVNSFFCVSVVRRVTGERRVGFLGTLDPLASGLMIMAVGEARKLISYMEGVDKCYEVVIRLGAVSDSYDVTGQMRENQVEVPPTQAQIQKLIDTDFSGEQSQTPPKFSAKWVDGKRAYDLARKGKDVHLKPKTVCFHAIELLRYEWPLLTLSVHCSSGTYIRSLAHDLGERLRVGGLVQALRRTRIADYDIGLAVKLRELNPENFDSYFYPVDKFFSHWLRMDLDNTQFGVLTSGGFIPIPSYVGRSLVNDDGISQPILAVYKGVPCAVLESWENGSVLKIKKRLNVI